MHRRESSVSLNRFGLGLPPPHSLTAVTTRLPYIVVLKAEKFIARDNRDNRAGFVKCGVVTPASDGTMAVAAATDMQTRRNLCWSSAKGACVSGWIILWSMEPLSKL